MRDSITTLLELVGLLCLVVAPALFVSHYSVPAGLATAGALLIGAAWLVSARTPKPRGDES